MVDDILLQRQKYLEMYIMNKLYFRSTLFTLSLTLILVSSVMSAKCQKCDSTCGPKSLLAAFQSLSIKGDLEQITRQLNKNEDSPTLEDLARIAEKKKLHTSIMKLKADDLTSLQVPAISLNWGNHFVLVESNGQGKLKVTDPNGEQKVMAPSELRSTYSGLVLLVSKDKGLLPTSPTATGPDIRFEWYVCDFGEVNQEDKIEKTVKVTNAGNELLTITSTRATCGCTPTVVSEKSIPSGGEGEVKIMFDMAGRQGTQYHKVYVHSNDPATPIAQLQLVGTVISPVVPLYPHSLNFGTLRKNECAYREINIPDTGCRNFRITGLTSDSQYINYTLITREAKGKEYYTIAISLTQDTPASEFSGKVFVHSTHPKEPVAKVPVKALVGEGVGCPSTQIYFGGVRQGQELAQTVTLHSSRRKDLKIEKVDCPIDGVSVKTAQVDGKAQAVITLTKDAPVGAITGEVVLHTNDPGQPQVKLPIYARVDRQN